jgi:hypothetical protein
MNGSSDADGPRTLSLELQLLEEFRAFEDAIAAMAAALPPNVVEDFAERAIDELLVDFARATRSPQAPKIHMALGKHLRAGVRRRLNELVPTTSREKPDGLDC